MKVHTTNYQDTLIVIADDCPATAGEVPPSKGEKKSIATMQFEILSKNPYKFTSDDVLFEVFAKKNDLTESELASAREQFFSKGQACFRASPLTKRYGWGVHSDAHGRIAMYDSASQEYEKLMNDSNIKTVKAMKSSR